MPTGWEYTLEKYNFNKMVYFKIRELRIIRNKNNDIFYKKNKVSRFCKSYLNNFLENIFFQILRSNGLIIEFVDFRIKLFKVVFPLKIYKYVCDHNHHSILVEI